MWGLTLVGAAVVGGLVTIASFRIYRAAQYRRLRRTVARGELRWAALIRFGVDRVFKGPSGQLLGRNDGTIRFEPSAYDRRHGVKVGNWTSDNLRWLPGESRDFLSGVHYRKVEIRIDDRTQLAGVFAVVGDPT